MANKSNSEIAVLLRHESGNAISYPANHKVGMVVPVGGSNCAKCEYVDGQNCKNSHFAKWNGGKKIPAPVDRYCCDFFEVK